MSIDNIQLITDKVSMAAAPVITKQMNGCTVVLRFATSKNEQVSVIIKELLIKSYTNKLFSQNA